MNIVSDELIAAIIGTIIGAAIAVLSQFTFYKLEIRRSRETANRELARERLDDFYSPMLVRLLEIEYKLWLELELQEFTKQTAGEAGGFEAMESSRRQILEEIDRLDAELLELFRRKRWLAFPSTVRHCQQLLRFTEAMKLSRMSGVSNFLSEWTDVKKLQPLHTDVRNYHDRLLKELGGPAAEVPLLADISQEEKLAFEKYLSSITSREMESPRT